MNGGIFTHINNPHIVLGSGKLADMNPSLVYYKNCYFLNQRIIDYTKLYSSDKFNIYTNSINQFIFNNSISKYNSVNVMTNVSDGRQWVVELPKHGKAAYTGLEDAKFVVWEDELYLYGTRCDVNNGQGNICVYQIDPFNFTVGNEWVVPNNTGVNVEKNWMAIPDKPFCFIYQPNPMTVIEGDPDNCTTRLYGSTKTNELGDNVRGSTPLIRIDTDTYLTLVHTSDGGFDSGGRYQLKYKFKAILLDNDFNVKKTSDWFVFMNELTEFCCGMCVNKNKISFTHSSFDCSSFLTELEFDKFMEFIELHEYTPNIFNNKFFYTTALSMERDGVNVVPWFNYLACTTKQTDKIHYESAVKVLAYWSCNSVFVSETLDNLRFLSYKYTKLFPDRCEAFYLSSLFEMAAGNVGVGERMKEHADKLRNGSRCCIDIYVPTHYL